VREDDGADGTALPALITAIPGPESVALIDLLARHESPGVTTRRGRANEARGLHPDPPVWARSRGANVWDADGNRYLDLTAGFGVALIGHGHPRVVEAVTRQAQTLLHAMGDVYPNPPRIRLMERLAELAPGDLSQILLTTSGSEAVEAALKTAVMKTGRSGVLAFEDSYHGLSYGALAVSHYKEAFRAPFHGQLASHVTHRPYGDDLTDLDRLLAQGDVGAILVEPILGRGGQVLPPEGWLLGLRRLADRRGAVLIFDEVYTGLGRTGAWWAGDHDRVVPDILCVGKALGGGMPVSAAVAHPDIMAAWGRAQGEAIHTSTFLGHPVAAAGALAALDVMEAMDAPRRAREIETKVRMHFGDRVRGRGAMLGIETGSPGQAAAVMGRLLKMGILVLPSGAQGDIVALTPPLVITDDQLDHALGRLGSALEQARG
jgi:4-aminobutyrate aminotransferase-like enzyme